MQLELIHASRVLRAWRDDPTRHVSDVSLFASQRHQRRPYSEEEISRLKELVRRHAWTEYIRIFYVDGDLYYRFAVAEPRGLSHPKCRETTGLLQTPKLVIGISEAIGSIYSAQRLIAASAPLARLGDGSFSGRREDQLVRAQSDFSVRPAILYHRCGDWYRSRPSVRNVFGQL
jgi:hypothetical protein